VTATSEPFVQAVFDIEVPRMAFGRVCLLGDAAFALRPHIAAGTAKAAADGWALAQALDEARGDVHGRAQRLGDASTRRRRGGAGAFPPQRQPLVVRGNVDPG
jgi:2-polyprenyl-6-methoxyphenol hydroxylase-like FAD-dependent oxidoreductase